MTQPLVSIVIPIYNEVAILDELGRRLYALLAEHTNYQWEVILVNDGSRDGSTEKMTALAEQYPWLSALHLSRNFGHQIAISAGVDYARGDAVIVMDGDLQDPPELIPQMVQKWRDGYHVVYATRAQREGETAFKLVTAKAFYRILDGMTNIKIPLDTGDFRLMSRDVVNALSSMREKNRFVRGLVSWVGFPQTAVYYERDKRETGETKYTLTKMVKFALDGIMSFSTVPLQWIMSVGFVISMTSFASIFLVLYLKLFTTVHVEPGWTSLMIGVLMLGGIQLVCLGMIGEYVGRIFDEVRGRPLYLIQNIDRGAVAPATQVSHHAAPLMSKEIALYEYAHAD